MGKTIHNNPVTIMCNFSLRTLKVRIQFHLQDLLAWDTWAWVLHFHKQSVVSLCQKIMVGNHQQNLKHLMLINLDPDFHLPSSSSSSSLMWCQNWSTNISTTYYQVFFSSVVKTKAKQKTNSRTEFLSIAAQQGSSLFQHLAAGRQSNKKRTRGTWWSRERGSTHTEENYHRASSMLHSKQRALCSYIRSKHFRKRDRHQTEGEQWKGAKISGRTAIQKMPRRNPRAKRRAH